MAQAPLSFVAESMTTPLRVSGTLLIAYESSPLPCLKSHATPMSIIITIQILQNIFVDHTKIKITQLLLMWQFSCNHMKKLCRTLHFNRDVRNNNQISFIFNIINYGYTSMQDSLLTIQFGSNLSGSGS